MTPEQLKASILQYAIQGKLVEQRPEEGTAEELYQQILDEKQKLIKEGKIKKEKPLAEITSEDIPYDIPATWKWVRWGNIVNIVSARRVHQSDWKEEGVPFYRAREIAEMSRNNGLVDNELFISEELYEEFSKSGVPKPGDIMVTAVGTLGKTYIVKPTDRFYYKDASVICFENRYNMCPEYLAIMMKTPLMRQQIKSNSEGTTVATLTMVRMVEYLCPLPPLEEQHRIVAKIKELLPYVDRYAESYEKLEQFNAKFPEDMKKSVLQYAIQGKLVEQRPEEGTAEELYQEIQNEKQKLIKEGKIKKEKPLAEIAEDEMPFDIPESWKWVRLRDIVFNHGQKTPETTFSYIDIGSIDNVNQKLNSEENLLEASKAPSRARKIVKYDDIIYSTVRPYLHNVCIIDKEFSAEPIASTGFAVLSCHKGVYNKYLFYYLLSPVFDLYANSTENAKGVAYPAINDDRLYRAVVPLPSLEEQHRIVAKIEELMPYCDRLKDATVNIG